MTGQGKHRSSTLLIAALAGLFALACSSASSSDGMLPEETGDAGADALPPEDAMPDPPGTDAGTDAAPTPAKRIVILMIGDGMGPGQVLAASLFAKGVPDALAMHGLPVRAQVTTASLSGITDSAAAATTLATGQRTWNGRIGLGRDGQPAQTLVELAHAHGLAAGLVTTASVPHATPGAFSAHRMSRHDYLGIADDQVRITRPDVLLGGGAQYFLPQGAGSVRNDGGLLDELTASGVRIVRTQTELAATLPGERVVGLFAAEHMDYVIDRVGTTTQPELRTMTAKALELLDADPDGFFLMVEGARIDMASHTNDLHRTVTETIAFDATISMVRAWAEGRDDVTLLVTADHECGGLTVTAPKPAGTLPQVTWRWGNHTNATVDLFAAGAAVSNLAGARTDFPSLHALAAGVMTSTPIAPDTSAVPDGLFSDLTPAVAQTNVSGFGPGLNQLDGLFIGADATGLSLGLGGVFEWKKNNIVLLLDVDHGAGTGVARLQGSVTDGVGMIDRVLAASQVTAPPVPGFGAELAVVVWGGQDPHAENLWPDAGVRGLVAPYGQGADLGWYGASINFADGTRATPAAPASAQEGAGMEILLPWTVLYPSLGGKVPPSARVSVVAWLANDDGGYASNQCLPPFAPNTVDPGRVPVPLPGVVVFPIDGDGDGVGGGGSSSPTILP